MKNLPNKKFPRNLGLRNRVTATITDQELIDFNRILEDRGGSISSLARQGILLLIQENNPEQQKAS